jgi:ADP-heptose:LPS heptosyltransferase
LKKVINREETNFGEMKKLADVEIKRLVKKIEEENKTIQLVGEEKRKDEEKLDEILNLFYPKVSTLYHRPSNNNN